MDETPIFLDMVPSKSIDKKGKKSIRIRTTKSEKRRTTAVLACTSNGETLPPMTILKGATTRSICGVACSGGILVSFQNKAWVNVEQTLKWDQTYWEATISSLHG